MKRGRPEGVSLVEIMVGLVILSILLSVAVMTLKRGSSRTSLTQTGEMLVGALRRVQAEANGKREYRGLCFKQDAGGQVFARLYIPALNAAGHPTDSDCTSGEQTTYQFNFKSNVTICTTCDTNVDFDKSIFFNPLGFSTSISGARTDYEICLIHSNLGAGTRAREIELSKMGIVKFLKVGETGGLAGVVANAGDCI